MSGEQKTIKSHNAQFTGSTEAFSFVQKNPSIPERIEAQTGEKLYTEYDLQARLALVLREVAAFVRSGKIDVVYRYTPYTSFPHNKELTANPLEELAKAIESLHPDYEKVLAELRDEASLQGQGLARELLRPIIEKLEADNAALCRLMKHTLTVAKVKGHDVDGCFYCQDANLPVEGKP